MISLFGKLLVKLMVTYDLEAYIGETYQEFFHGIPRSFLIGYREIIETPFEDGWPKRVDPSILKGRIFTVIGDIEDDEVPKIEHALEYADLDALVVFWNTDNACRFVPFNEALLQNFLVIRINKIPLQENLCLEFQDEFLYIFIKNHKTREKIKQYIFDQDMKYNCHIHAEVIPGIKELEFHNERRRRVKYEQAMTRLTGELQKVSGLLEHVSGQLQKPKKILYTFYHCGAFGWVLIHKLFKHPMDEAYLLLADGFDWNSAYPSYRRTLEKFIKKGIFSGIYTYNMLLGLNGKDLEETEKNISNGIDETLKNQGCDLKSFDKIYSTTDNFDTIGIYFNMNKIEFEWFEFASDLLVMKNEDTIREDYSRNVGYRDALLKHGTMYGKSRFQSYVLFPESNSESFPKNKINFFNPNPICIMLSTEEKACIFNCFELDRIPQYEHSLWIILQSGYCSGELWNCVKFIQKQYMDWKQYYYYSIQTAMDYFVPCGTNPILKPHPSNIIDEEVSNQYFSGIYAFDPLFTISLINILPQKNLPEYVVIFGSSANKQLPENIQKISCGSVIYFSAFYQKYFIAILVLKWMNFLYQGIGECFEKIESNEFDFVYQTVRKLPNEIDMLIKNDIDMLIKLWFTDMPVSRKVNYRIHQNFSEKTLTDIASHDFIIYIDVWETLTIHQLLDISKNIHTGIIQIFKKPFKKTKDILVPLQNEYIFLFTKNESYLQKLNGFSAIKTNKAMGIDLQARMISMEEYMKERK